MEFVHRPYVPGETIAAIATPPGEGGIAIVRISGREAFEVGGAIFSGNVKNYLSHTAHVGVVRDREGRKVDQALCLVMRGPHSYTGEDTVELQCHGGMLASKRVLEAALGAGARLAGPGEFTFKAFMNGRLDLAQAEAVQQLIGAKNGHALAQAERHLEGELTERVTYFQERLTHIAAILEAWVDFPEEGLAFAPLEEVVGELKGVVGELERLLATYDDGKRLACGIALCLVGAPNVGKSSLMNRLLKKERAIVTEVAGTTRDLLEEEMTLGGLHFRLTDTAGIRETEEVVEKEGIRRSKEALEAADLVLLVLDLSRELLEEERRLLEEVPAERTVVVWNKCDVQKGAVPPLKGMESVALSAKEGTGVAELCSLLERRVWREGAPPQEEVLLTTVRHKEGIEGAHSALTRLVEGLEGGLSPEFLSSDIRQALRELGTIKGVDVQEEILSSIFATFCVGK